MDKGFYTRTKDGEPIHPGDGIVPILKPLDKYRLLIVGTGFYVTRYGLFVTAKHVIDELLTSDEKKIIPSYVCHLEGKEEIRFREIKKTHFLYEADLAIAQADNLLNEEKQIALSNLRGTLSCTIPKSGTPLTTYAYPENKILDFSRKDDVPTIAGDYFAGGFLRFVPKPENPLIKLPYFETSVEARPGASGAPIFDPEGRIIGVCSRGWSFSDNSEGENQLSYFMPIFYLLNLKVDLFMMPSWSWEAQQIPNDKQGQLLSIRELGKFGHMSFDPELD